MYISYHILLKNTIYSKTLVYETTFIPPLKSSGFSALMFIKSRIQLFEHGFIFFGFIFVKEILRMFKNSQNIVIITLPFYRIYERQHIFKCYYVVVNFSLLALFYDVITCAVKVISIQGHGTSFFLKNLIA